MKYETYMEYAQFNLGNGLDIWKNYQPLLIFTKIIITINTLIESILMLCNDSLLLLYKNFKKIII